MKAHNVVALTAISSGVNLPGEYVVAVVHPLTGRLIQRSGHDGGHAHGLLKLLSVFGDVEETTVEAASLPKPHHPLSHVQEVQ